MKEDLYEDLYEDLHLKELDAKIAIARARLEDLDDSRRVFVEKLQHKEIDQLEELLEQTHLRLRDLEQPIIEAWQELHQAIISACERLKLCATRDDERRD